MGQDKQCEKFELTGTDGFRVIYCRRCDVVELEIGALSLRLSPEMVQRFANILMKASLRLERVANSGNLVLQAGGTLH